MHARLKPRVDHLFRKYLFVFYAKIIYQFLDHFEVNETPWVYSTPTNAYCYLLTLTSREAKEVSEIPRSILELDKSN